MMPTSTAYAPRASERAVEAQLGSYRSQVTPILLQTIPRGEPKKHLYDLVEMQLQREGKGIRPALCLATCGAFGGKTEQALPSAAALEDLAVPSVDRIVETVTRRLDEAR